MSDLKTTGIVVLFIVFALVMRFVIAPNLPQVGKPAETETMPAVEASDPPPLPPSPDELRAMWGGDHSPIGLTMEYADGSRRMVYGSASLDIPNRYGVRWWPDTPPLEGDE